MPLIAGVTIGLFQLGMITNRSLIWAFLLSLGVQLAVLTIPAAAPGFKVTPLPLEDWELMAFMGLFPLSQWSGQMAEASAK